MQDSEQIALIKRALQHLEKKTTDTGPAYAAPADFYRSGKQLEREREILFTRYPLPVGFASQIKNPGDYFVFDVIDHSILVTRDDSGKLGAFANFCRHRGTKLTEGEGHCKKIICPYHAWAYGLDGKLLAAPHKENYPDLKDCQLKSFPVAERYGLVWIKPTLGGSMDLDRELGVFAQDLGTFGFDSHTRFGPVEFRSPIGWKLMIEAALETYHFKYTHAKTIAPMFFDDLGVFDWSSPHGRMLLPKQGIKELRDRKESEWKIRPVGNIIYFFFPNTVLLVQPDHATWMSSYPISERESLIRGGTLIPESPGDGDSEKYWKKNVDVFWQAINEDYAMSERIQKGLNSGTVDEVHFGRTEFLIERFHEEIRQALS